MPDTDFMSKLGLAKGDIKAKPVAGTNYLSNLGLSDEDIVKAPAAAPGAKGNELFQKNQAGMKEGFSNFAMGVAQGGEDAFAGAIQAGLSQIDPALAKQFTDFVNKHKVVENNDTTGGQAGAMVGNAVPWMVGGEALGATRLGAAAAKVPALIKDALIGAGIGSTQFYADPENANRLQDAITGAFGSTIVGGAARKGTEVMAKVVNKIGIGKFIKELVSQIEGETSATNPLKIHINDEFERLNKIKTAKYNLRDAKGGELSPLDGEHVTEGIKALELDLKKSSVSNRIGDTVKKVKKILGTAEDKGGEITVGGMTLDPNNPDHATMLNLLKAQGIGAEPVEVEASQLFNSITEVNKQIGGTKDPAKVNQLKQLKNVLNGYVEQIATQSGRPASSLMAAHNKANQFFKDNIDPYRKLFGYSPDGPTGNLTNKQIYDKAVNIIESDDGAQLFKLKKVAGGKNSDALKKVFIRRALESSIDKKGGFDGNKVYEYFTNHQAARTVLFSAKERAQIDGFGKMLKFSYNSMKSPAFAVSPGKAVSAAVKGINTMSHRMTAPLLTFFGLEHAFRGDFAGAAELVTSGVAASFVFNRFNQMIESNGGRAIMEAASKLPENSPALAKLIEKSAPLLGSVSGAEAGVNNPYAGQLLGNLQ